MERDEDPRQAQPPESPEPSQESPPAEPQAGGNSGGSEAATPSKVLLAPEPSTGLEVPVPSSLIGSDAGSDVEAPAEASEPSAEPQADPLAATQDAARIELPGEIAIPPASSPPVAGDPRAYQLPLDPAGTSGAEPDPAAEIFPREWRLPSGTGPARAVDSRACGPWNGRPPRWALLPAEEFWLLLQKRAANGRLSRRSQWPER